MSIAADSRYVFGDYETVQVSPTAFDVAVFSGNVVITDVPISFYMSVQGDRFDKLAARYFGDGTKWWVIADLNQEVRWPGDIPAGSVIRIPLFTDTVGLNETFDSSLGNILSAGGTRG